MQIEIKYSPSYSIAFANLDQGEAIRAESGAMVSHSTGLQMETKAQGGLLKGLKRAALGGEGLVCTLTGPGRIYLQTRSPSDFLGWLIPQLPTPSS